MGSAICRKKKTPQEKEAEEIEQFWDLLAEPVPSEFSEVEMTILSWLWKHATEGRKARELGFHLFEKLFVFFPDVQTLFFSHETRDYLSSQQWKDHPLFVSHVRRVMDTIDVTISLLEKESQLYDFLDIVEVFHRNLQGMKMYYFEIFIKIIDVVMSEQLGKLYEGENKRVFRKLLALHYYSFTRRLLV